MLGRSQHSIRILRTLFFIFAVSCREYENPALHGSEQDFFQESCPASDGNQNHEPVVEEIPDGSRFQREEGSIPLTPMDISFERGCALFSSPMSFSIREAESGVFLIQPVPELPYCVTIHRRNGYITLLHEEGDVTRNGDIFTWCIERTAPDEKNGEPARLEVLSLTPTAEFWLTMRRGME